MIKYLSLALSICYISTCMAVVIENNNGIVKVDKWGTKKAQGCKIKPRHTAPDWTYNVHRS